jgi:hypothetical protein
MHLTPSAELTKRQLLVRFLLTLLLGVTIGVVFAVVLPNHPYMSFLTVGALSGLSAPINYGLRRYIAKRPYDGNNRSRVFPAPPPDDE